MVRRLISILIEKIANAMILSMIIAPEEESTSLKFDKKPWKELMKNVVSVIMVSSSIISP